MPKRRREKRTGSSTKAKKRGNKYKKIIREVLRKMSSSSSESDSESFTSNSEFDDDSSIEPPDDVENANRPPPGADQNLDDILGSNPDEEAAIGPPMNEQIYLRWSTYITKGLDKEKLKELHQTYAFPSNGELLQAPLVNPEVYALLSNEQKNTDSYLSKVQNNLGRGLAALSQVLNVMLDTPEKSEDTKKLVDAAKLITEGIHGINTHRRFLTSSKLSTAAKKVAHELPSGKFLFGNDFQEKCKTAKEVEKNSKEIKALDKTSVPQNLNSKRRNFKQRKREQEPSTSKQTWKRRPQMTMHRYRQPRRN